MAKVGATTAGMLRSVTDRFSFCDQDRSWCENCSASLKNTPHQLCLSMKLMQWELNGSV